MSVLVIRLSSLGDIVLTGAVTGALAPATFLTSRRYAEVAAALPGVEAVLCWEDGVPQRRFDRIIDLHASPRSRWIASRVPGRVSRVRRYDVRRRARVAFKRLPPPPVVDRYAAAAGGQPAPWPWVMAEGPRDALLICPGSAHATKLWPADRYAAVAQRWCGTGSDVVLLGSAGEAGLLHGIAERLDTGARVVAEDGFAETLAALGRGRVALGGDTGLTHLCAAAGVPTAIIFGPTTSTDGFWGHGGRPIEASLPCRPCSRHGGEVCPYGDHLCISTVNVETIWSTIQDLGKVA